MKLDIQGESIILMFKEGELNKVNFKNIEAVESYFRATLLKLKELYELEIKGFYNIYVYVDKKEGMVLKLEKEPFDYYDNFHQIEMRIIKEDVIFLYEIDDILRLPYHALDIYIYEDKFYAKSKNKKKVLDLYEFGTLVYENTKRILENGNKVTIL